MPEAKPKAWFTSPIARISYRKVDKYDHMYAKLRPFFPTWAEAHAWMLQKATKDLKTAEQNLASAKRHMAKLKAMTDPGKKDGADESVASGAKTARPAHESSGFASPLVLIWVAAVTLVLIAITSKPEAPAMPPAPVPGATVAYRPFVFIDDATGCHYLSTHNSTGMAPRIAPDGKSHMGCKGEPQ